MQFKIGQTVAHSSHGIGVIKAIEERQFGVGPKSKFYIMEILDCGTPKKVFVPFDTNHKLRSIITKDQVAAVYETLFNPATVEIDHQTWNRRYRDYMERLATGNIMDVVVVVRSLFNLRKEKDLNFGERKLLDQAVNLLTKELAMAENLSEQEVQSKLETFFI